jgi:hypothetical protein
MSQEGLKDREFLASRLIWSGLGLYVLGGAFLTLWGFLKLISWLTTESGILHWIIQGVKAASCG